MGIFDTLFGGESEEKEKMNWNLITATNQLDDILQKSNSKSQLIFKHSTRCGIS